MVYQKTNTTWIKSFVDPSANRLLKPRHKGITMLMDKGLGQHQYMDVMQTCSEHIDFIKLGFGTSVLYPLALLENKIKWAEENDINVYPGGTFFEIAYIQGKINEYYENISDLGFKTVEISDGSIYLSRPERDNAIRLAKEWGFNVITECGSKTSGSNIEIKQLKDTLTQDLACGAQFVIVEGRESGKDVGVYNKKGEIDTDFIESLHDELGDLTQTLIWEAPQKEQQVYFIKHFGTNVNIGNISAQELYALESLRRGLRSDTFELVK